ncbi:NAD(P)H-dependent oxidoreductase subunit E [Kribbella sp. CA-293567]|uniref:NAD(P)H-dependent oxidoreductase subunit E n=1 Tax=Kribbella sp. CA-293567 TaxID=3002436 RepID=UPI0022DD187A|nr:NAD(P)H-dependent oxidoreductase subunit E [Kribbella sp. CA-293567]WBQ04759.1 NAD(P)H-dependent oxidoreductase subunit E [Kribbella sp. CA-293567]
MTTEVIPPASVPAPGRAVRVRGIAAGLRGLRGALIPILHAVQEELGYVDQTDIAVIADVLNLAVAEVHGVVTFYRDFRREPAGRTTVRICQAEACRSVGAEELAAHVKRRTGAGFGETTYDRRLTVDEVFCLGNCALGPAVQVSGKLHGRVTPARLDALLGEAR